MIVIDECQNLLLRAVGGLDGWRTFHDVVGRTSSRVVWLCAFSRYAWEYAESVEGTDSFDVLRLLPWDEDSIEALLRRRLERAGWRAVIEGSDARNRQGDDVLPRDPGGLLRLLLDRSDGIPRVAVDCWARSLQPQEDRVVKVRMAAVPSPDALEVLPVRTSFMLAAVVLHENLTAGEAAEAVHDSEKACDIILQSLTTLGLMEKRDDRYRVTPFWHRSAVRYLRRKHLLHS